MKLGHATVFPVTGSSGSHEVPANQMPAAKCLGCGTGAPVELRIPSL
ncbi:MAG: hypothetical protein IPM24_13025 [Bryobacterales bacterium]|nr:hypothetical protein [Bryobacterales bacterium]